MSALVEKLNLFGWDLREFTEFAATVLLSLAGVATSWSSYQSSLWSGIQSTQYSRAGAQRTRSAIELNTSYQLMSVDVAVFMSWVNAYESGNERLATFYEQRFRNEFRPAFRAWMAKRPLENAAAPGTPFALPEYRLKNQQRADALDTAANASFEAGQYANRCSDRYVMLTVVLALVLFSSGISQQFRLMRVRGFLLCLASVLLAGGFVAITQLPRAY